MSPKVQKFGESHMKLENLCSSTVICCGHFIIDLNQHVDACAQRLNTLRAPSIKTQSKRQTTVVLFCLDLEMERGDM